MKKNFWAAALMAVVVLMGGCKNSGHAQNSTDLRALNAVVDAEPLDVLVDDDVKFAADGLGTTTSYTEFSSGTHDLKVRSSVNQSVLLDKASVSFASGANQLLVIYGKRGALLTQLLVDDTNDPSSGHLKFRVTGLSPDAGPLDIYLSTGDISSTPATVSNVNYGTTTDYFEITPGSFRVVFTTAGTKDIVFQSANTQTFSEGAKMTIAVFPAIGGKLVNAVLLTQGTGAAGTFLPNPLSRLKAVNAIPDSTPLNFKADGNALLGGVPFMGSSSYVTAAAGGRTLQIEASNVPGTTIASVAQTLDPARDYTAVAVNSLAQAQLVVFPDDNTVPVAGFAKIRFANVLAGSASVDVLVNFASQASGVAYKSVSGTYSLPASLTDTITFTTPGGVSVIATISNVEIDAGAVYTVYLFGTSASPQARLVRDR